jgi:gluconolactonase
MRRHVLVLLALPALALVWALAPAPAEEKTYPTMGTIERVVPAEFNKLIPAGARLEQLVGGFDWVEGPVWIPKDGGFLLCSDIPKNAIIKWQGGKKSVFLQPAGYTGSRTDLKEPGTNGLILSPKGDLILCEHGDRRVTRLRKVNPRAKKVELAHKYMGKLLNSPNDGTFKSNGDFYFTDPPYGRALKDKEGFPNRELDFCGVYRLSKDGKLTLLTKEMSKPNGIAFSPDEKTLYVANSDPKRAIWMAFPVKADGTLGKGKVFFDATKWVDKKLGLPDGMKVDRKGNLFATGPGGVLVFSPDGKHLGTIATGTRTSNCGWGEDGTVLYVTADKHLCRIQTNTKGPGF